MTPDTAEFPKDLTWPIREWTEDEDGIIESVSQAVRYNFSTSPR